MTEPGDEDNGPGGLFKRLFERLKKVPVLYWMVVPIGALSFIAGFKDLIETAAFLHGYLCWIDAAINTVSAAIMQLAPIPEPAARFLAVFSPFVLIGVVLVLFGKRMTNLFVALLAILLLEFGLLALMSARNSTSLGEVGSFLLVTSPAALIVWVLAAGGLIGMGALTPKDKKGRWLVPTLLVPLIAFIAFAIVFVMPTLLGMPSPWPVDYILWIDLVFVLPLLAPEAVIAATVGVAVILGGSWLSVVAGLVTPVSQC